MTTVRVAAKGNVKRRFTAVLHTSCGRPGHHVYDGSCPDCRVKDVRDHLQHPSLRRRLWFRMTGRVDL